MDAWKRRDEVPDASTSLREFGEEGHVNLAPLSIDHLPDPMPEELVAWLNREEEDEDEARWGLDEEGVYRLTTYNPNSKWDWYEVGGRWTGYFKLKAEAMDSAEPWPPLAGRGRSTTRLATTPTAP